MTRNFCLLAVHSKEDIDDFPCNISVIEDACRTELSQRDSTRLCSCCSNLLQELLRERDPVQDTVTQSVREGTREDYDMQTSGSGYWENWSIWRWMRATLRKWWKSSCSLVRSLHPVSHSETGNKAKRNEINHTFIRYVFWVSRVEKSRCSRINILVILFYIWYEIYSVHILSFYINPLLLDKTSGMPLY